MSDRPPLHPIQWEQIELAAKQVDASYWRELKTLQVHYAGPATLSPAKTPLLLLNRLEMYAGALFRLEAAQYPKENSHYRAWLEALAARIMSRVLRAVEEVDAVSPDAKLTWHSLGIDKMRDGLEVFFRVVVAEYAGNATKAPLQGAMEAQPQPAGHMLAPEKPTQREKIRPQEPSRKELADAYKAQFPGAKWADVAWAARQTYRELKRWRTGEAKDGSKPDLAFRRVLTSGKPPSELRSGHRPTTRG